MQRKTITRQTQQAQLYRCDLPNDYLSGEYGIEPCEALLLVYTDEDRKPRDGERVYLHYARYGMGCGCIGYGTFKKKANGRFSVVHSDGEDDKPKDHHKYLMRLVGVVRQGKHEFFEGESKQWMNSEALPLRESDFVMSDEEYEAEFGHPFGAEVSQPSEEKRSEPKGSARINYLKSRLNLLLDEGEAHNESGVFRLRREIYDLENKPDDDEWPEVIGDE